MNEKNQPITLYELTKGFFISGNTIFWFSKLEDFSPDAHLCLQTLTYEQLPDYLKRLQEDFDA